MAYTKINYKGNPLDKNVQTKVHQIYNSLTPELQDKWLEQTSGMGWSDNYIKVALNFWNKQDKYINVDKEMVDEYMTTLTNIEKDNFNDICEVFCPDKPYVHIKNSCGFIEYQENKKKITSYLNNLSPEGRDELENDIDELEQYDKYHYILGSNEYIEWLSK